MPWYCLTIDASTIFKVGPWKLQCQPGMPIKIISLDIGFEMQSILECTSLQLVDHIV